MNLAGVLKNKIVQRKAKICVVGIGYVGLPLAVEFAKAGFKVWGLDIDTERVSSLRNGKSYIDDISNQDLKEVMRSGNFIAVSSYDVIKKCDVIIMSVPTPLCKTKTKEPDISFIVNCLNEITGRLRKGQLIILESTTYPGTTREIIASKLEENGFDIGEDLYLCFSPERIDPGNKKFKFADIPKIVGGLDKISSLAAACLYEQIIKKVVIVSSAEVAEMAKLLENTFRAVNIGLANEMQLLCHNLDIDVWEVIKAASTKPYGFMPFYPGPGLGGHCIPVDPVYLSWRAKLSGFETRLIDAAQEVNRYMPEYVAGRITMILNQHKKPVRGSKILIVGVSYKKDIRDVRESPAFEIISLLNKAGSLTSYYDPYVEQITVEGRVLKSKRINKQSLSAYDMVCIVTAHTNIDYQIIVKYAKLVFDTRNVLEEYKSNKRIFRI